LEATITLECIDAKTAEAIANAVSPDNFKTPAGLFIKTFRNGSNVVTEIRAEEKLATFIATIDDLLFSVATAEKTIRVTKEK
jgi:tRNA threonylcarbamoyladenosine modification (KEOPS) complex  Pcc1 subunit